MNYETAKLLKDNGFPQETAQYYYGQGYSLNNEFSQTVVYDLIHRDKPQPIRPWIEYVAAPTLEELIEACGNNLTLEKFEHTDGHTLYRAMKRGKIAESKSSLEEAVANLWISLNKKAE